ncbi:MAG: N-acetylmuramoyl-L-alanine amidase [Eubacteriales bacterium]|nr:N-acetylmuramoyl-L-alanine amidase [Eubacteriales bacterium]
MRFKRMLALLCASLYIMTSAAAAADMPPTDSAAGADDIAVIAADSAQAAQTEPNQAGQIGAALPVVRAAAPKVVPSTHKVQVNGAAVNPQAYNIDGYNYFKLRDIAFLLSGTTSSFDVEWSGAKQAINLVSGQRYTAVGGEMNVTAAAALRVQASTAAVLLDGSGVSIKGYNINGNNYYKIADVSAAMGFTAAYESATKTVQIKTAPAPVPEPEPDPEPEEPDEPFVTGIYQVKVDSSLSVRSGPGTTYTVIGKLSNGDKIVVDALSDGWAHIMDTSGGDRYCSADYLTRLSDYDPSSNEPDPTPPPKPPRTSHIDGKMTIILDPGHGGSDIGAHNADMSLDEKHINLYVAQYLQQYLEDAGCTVIMVRDTLEEGSALSLRGTVIERYADSADLFFSIHHNAVNTTARGAEVLAQISDKNGGPSKILAEALMAEYRKIDGLPIRQIVFREGSNGDYYYTNRVATSVQMPAVTSEFCFIDNEEDQKLIDSEEDWQIEAQAQFNAIMRYFEQVEY